MGSDHRVVCSRIKLSLRTSKTTKKIRYDWQQFSSDPELQQKYTVAVRNQFQVLEEDTGDIRFEKFVNANKRAMEECVPKKAKAKRSLWSSSAKVQAARQEALTAQSQYGVTKSEEDKEAWSHAVKNLYQVYDRVREEELEEQIKNVESAHGAQRYGEAWKIVNEVAGRKRAIEGQVEGSSPKERVTTWFTHFKNLIGNTPEVEKVDEEIFEEMDIRDSIFTLDE